MTHVRKGTSTGAKAEWQKPEFGPGEERGRGVNIYITCSKYKDIIK